MSGAPAWVVGGRLPESLDDNDTFAYSGNQSSVWGRLQRDRVLQCVRRCRTGPTYSVPHRVGE